MNGASSLSYLKHRAGERDGAFELTNGDEALRRLAGMPQQPPVCPSDLQSLRAAQLASSSSDKPPETTREWSAGEPELWPISGALAGRSIGGGLEVRDGARVEMFCLLIIMSFRFILVATVHLRAATVARVANRRDNEADRASGQKLRLLLAACNKSAGRATFTPL